MSISLFIRKTRNNVDLSNIKILKEFSRKYQSNDITIGQWNNNSVINQLVQIIYSENSKN